MDLLHSILPRKLFNSSKNVCHLLYHFLANFHYSKTIFYPKTKQLLSIPKYLDRQ